ncbi:response regulator transcription factor [Pseudoalteromonas sp. SG44-8]|uniref:response regulator n=1 Tax=Pseudoalteromonas sp. SG44-8 TaxID=2760958 RepID=UPI0016020B85|nr:response regulator transcription factor [Pseudoalteromonas sp. SG44-8]MBB1396702.1 response regulator transcription factor [Pseudoalteromonas sp. SG44-8]
MANKIQILNVDDHPIFSFGLKESLQIINENYSVKCISDSTEALSYLKSNTDIDLVLLDLSMPNVNGVSFLRALQASTIIVPIAILSAQEDIDLLTEALSLGIVGIISKNSDIKKISNSIGRVLNGELLIPQNLQNSLNAISKYSKENTETVLSKRQFEILKMLQAGLSNQGIGEVLFISELTVKSHLRTIFKILGATNRLDCVRKAEHLKIIKRL